MIACAKIAIIVLAVLLGMQIDAQERRTSENRNSTKQGKKNFQLRKLEKIRFHDAVRNARQLGYTIRGFYHTSNWQPYWKNVLEEQLNILDGKRPQLGDEEVEGESYLWSAAHWASLVQVSDELYLNVAVPSMKDYQLVKDFVQSLDLKHQNKIFVHFNKTVPRSTFNSMPESQKSAVLQDSINLSEGEVSTVSTLHKYCQQQVSLGKKAIIYYLHSKSGFAWPRTTHDPVHKPCSDWRDVMNTFNLEFPSICLRAITSGYQTCGYAYQDSHYSGNYWWADCDHVAALPALTNRFDAYAVEYFIFNVTAGGDSGIFGSNCGYHTHHCRVNHYDQPCPRRSYLKLLQDFVTQEPILPNFDAKINKTAAWAKAHCSSLHSSGSYVNQPEWKSWSDYQKHFGA